MKLKTLSKAMIGLAIMSVHAAELPGKPWPERLRGFNTEGPRAALTTEKTFENLSRWKVNLLRLNFRQARQSELQAGLGKNLTPVPDYMKPYQLHLTRLEKTLALCEKHHIYMIIAASGIGGRDKKNVAEATSSGVNAVSYERNLLAFWQYIATKYKDNPMVIGYDLLNEPHTKDEIKHWQARTIPRLVRAIRAIDRETTLVIEPGPWGLPVGYNTFKPVDDPKVVYSFHFYAPHNYTHQRVGKAQRDGSGIYPGPLQMFNTSPEKMWDRTALEENMKPAIEFARKHNVRMFVGEFSVIRWARSGAAQWVEDAVSLFEKHGWDWAYHSYTGWNGWNPTVAADAKQSNEPDGGADTERLKVLKKYWGLND
jgi:aryl-phospho-beta-D-glucosidase BglC (GH1 family)